MNANNILLHGVGITAEKAAGKLRFFRPDSVKQAPRNTPSEESQAHRLKDALRKTKETLSLLHQRALLGVGEAEAEIFEIHAMLLDDDDFNDALNGELANGHSAEDAVHRAVSLFSEQLRATNDEYLAARTADLKDIESQLMDQLSGAIPDMKAPQDHPAGDPYILVAEDLTPSQTILLERSMILGFVTFGGTPREIDALIREEVEKLSAPEGGLMMIYGLYPGTSLENAEVVANALEKYAGLH